MRVLILEDSKERIVQFKKALIGHTIDITEYSKEAVELLSKDNYDI